jgi:spermidine/putrescine transport system substrate-binding protein
MNPAKRPCKNSENPAELEAALHRLPALRAQARTAGRVPEVSEQALASGEVALMYGWAGDVLRARARNLDIRYVVPAEGSIQWGDNFVILVASPHKRTAEVFIDFLLRPEISARIANELYYATPNEAAYPFIKPEILGNPVIFPPIEDIRRGGRFTSRFGGATWLARPMRGRVVSDGALAQVRRH